MSLHDTSVRDLRLVDETALDVGDPCFTKEELDQFSHKLLRRLAAQSNSDEINGKSNQLELRAFYHCQRSLSDYAND